MEKDKEIKNKKASLEVGISIDAKGYSLENHEIVLLVARSLITLRTSEHNKRDVS
jgi:hypothetical protein